MDDFDRPPTFGLATEVHKSDVLGREFYGKPIRWSGSEICCHRNPSHGGAIEIDLNEKREQVIESLLRVGIRRQGLEALQRRIGLLTYDSVHSSQGLELLKGQRVFRTSVFPKRS